MRPILLPDPPSLSTGVPEIFEQGGSQNVVRRAVVIGNGFPGSENQCIGLVRALGLAQNHLLYRVTRPKGGINEWLHWLPVGFHKKLDFILRHIYLYSRLMLGSKQSKYIASENVGLSSILEADVKSIVSMARDTYEKDGPLVVIACGRDTVSIASSIRRLASENVFVVQIQHPRSHLNRFDMVITPRHDYYPITLEAQEQVPRFMRSWITPREPPQDHVVLTTGALHGIDYATLRKSASAWHDEFAALPKPLVVVNIGWPRRNCRYGADLAKQLTDALLSVLDSCGSVRIALSYKTPEKVSRVVFKELGDNPKVFIWNGQEPNPYMGHLAWGDAFVVTADSVSLISEACSTGKPVYVIGADHCKWKIADFHKSLRERGVVRPFTGLEDMSESWSYPPLNDTAEAATRVRSALATRGWSLRS
ncbi:Mitochondrial fission protein ELM1 [Raphanus sativus]|uniref:Mitochondrial fission protein ELM1 n=1 Tax=Raphanus sativus TaxID=3726 RepID=A0A6J0KGI5_RAPSA|nr:mitochondrial fission protein ELM1 [Raphanus sativus]XP_056846804.1 mitochondrial fission protein ELM1 [Raphanus sativus]XP_056846805.1 mitochondrial fission protein ELM1 [Raphanus sativus]XP_056846806.1 mitochondrial fission protein ELM1 [Raphanus sativus]KAJ4883640.1 Mitochondrial fission protein ELM1 [Raphanus sativus]